jgi:Outer membrane protein beta-barrel domain
MKRLLPIAIASFLACSVNFTAQAQSSRAIYAEASYSLMTHHSSTKNQVDSTPHALDATIGYNLNQYIAVEGLAGFSSKDNHSQGLKFNNTYGVFFKAKNKVSERIEVFGRIGSVNSASTPQAASVDDASVSLGLGLNYSLDKSSYISGSFNSLLDRTGSKSSGFTLGAGYRF